MGLTDNKIALALKPVQDLADATAAVAGVDLVLNTTTPETPTLPIQIEMLKRLLIALSGISNYPDVFEVRTNMQNDALLRRIVLLEQRVASGEQLATSAQLVNDAQERLLRLLADKDATQDELIAEIKIRIDLLKADGQNMALDLAANQAHDTEQDARLSAEESLSAAQALDLKALHQQQGSTTAALAANTAADQATAAQVAATQATANQALALGQSEHATNVSQQSQLDANAAQDALDRARQTADEAAIAQAQATATAALQKANDDALAASQAQTAATTAQTMAATASQAAAAAQTSANAAQTRADLAEADAQTAKTMAATAQAKADADAIAAANAQTAATAAQQAAATNATALAALQTALAGKLDAALVRRGSQTTGAITIQLATPSTVPVTFATPFADANYEVFLSKPAGGLLGVELGWQNKTKDGFTLTLRNTGLASLAVPASSVDYFAIHN